MSEVGFEPTPSYEDQNSHTTLDQRARVNLESGALDHSAILTYSLGKCSMSEIKEQSKALACKLLPYKRARPVKLGEKDRPRVGSNHQPFG